MMNMIPSEIVFSIALLSTLIPLALVLRKIFSEYKTKFNTTSSIYAGIMLASLILFAYSLLIGLLCYGFGNWFENNRFFIQLIGYCIWLAVYGVLISSTIFIAILLRIIVIWITKWIKCRLSMNKK